MMSSEQPEISLLGQQVPVVHLDEYGFKASLPLEEATRSSGTLQLREESLEVEFRVREISAGVATCSFANLSLASADAIKKYLSQRERGFTSGLESRSYDELADGVIDDPSVDKTDSIDVASADKAFASLTDADTEAEVGVAPAIAKEPSPRPQNQLADRPDKIKRRSSDVPKPVAKRKTTQNEKANSKVKSLVMLLMLLAMIGLAVLSLYFLRSRSTLNIGNSSLVGNYLPVNAKIDGEIVELLVNEGDMVEKGQTLVRLKNPAMEMAMEHCDASLRTAKAKVRAIKKQLVKFEQKLKVAAKKLELDLEIAQSEQIAALKMLNSAKASVDVMAPAVAKGAVSRAEFSVVENEYLAVGAALTAANNSVKQIQFSQSAIKDKVLILGDRVDDEMGRLTAELEIAQAEQQQAALTSQVAKSQFESLSMKAPRSGRVFVTYRQVGEFVKVADETVAISFDGKVWAAGQVSASQASRVRPGQPVTIRAPSLGEKFSGFVLAVGHRAMYSHGRYTADFRGETATDVPVKVMIPELPEGIPSGIRLEMAINTGFGVEWIDKTMGYELKPVGGLLKSQAKPSSKALVTLNQ